MTAKAVHPTETFIFRISLDAQVFLGRQSKMQRIHRHLKKILKYALGQDEFRGHGIFLDIFEAYTRCRTHHYGDFTIMNNNITVKFE